MKILLSAILLLVTITSNADDQKTTCEALISNASGGVWQLNSGRLTINQSRGYNGEHVMASFLPWPKLSNAKISLNYEYAIWGVLFFENKENPSFVASYEHRNKTCTIGELKNEGGRCEVLFSASGNGVQRYNEPCTITDEQQNKKIAQWYNDRKSINDEKAAFRKFFFVGGCPSGYVFKNKSCFREGWISGEETMDLSDSDLVSELGFVSLQKANEFFKRYGSCPPLDGWRLEDGKCLPTLNGKKETTEATLEEILSGWKMGVSTYQKYTQDEANRIYFTWMACPIGWHRDGLKCTVGRVNKVKIESRARQDTASVAPKYTQDEADKYFFNFASCPLGWRQQNMGCQKNEN